MSSLEPLRARASWALAILAVGTAAGTMVLAECSGSRARGRSVAPSPIAAHRAPHLLPDARAAYDALCLAGVRARVLVSLSSFLHFVDSEAGVERLGDFPFGRPASLAGELNDQTLLWILARTNRARHVISVLPREVFEGKLANAGRPPRGGAVALFDYGLQRTLAAEIPSVDEPVVLVIDASLFLSPDADRLLASLRRSGLRADLLLLNEARDNARVTPGARDRLRQLAAALSDGAW